MSSKDFFRRERLGVDCCFLRAHCAVLKNNTDINFQNEKLVVETLRKLAELMVWGDQHNEAFFLYVFVFRLLCL
jgi:hypothetical protein